MYDNVSEILKMQLLVTVNQLNLTALKFSYLANFG